MNHYASQWIDDWCQDNGWTDWFIERSSYWAFPPNAVMPMPIPSQALRSIKANRGLSFTERLWCLSAIAGAVGAGISSYLLSSPMPMVAAFAFCAIAVAQLEDETVY